MSLLFKWIDTTFYGTVQQIFEEADLLSKPEYIDADHEPTDEDMQV